VRLCRAAPGPGAAAATPRPASCGARLRAPEPDSAAAAQAIQSECARSGVICSVVGVPKSIDNDILLARPCSLCSVMSEPGLARLAGTQPWHAIEGAIKEPSWLYNAIV